MDYTRKIEREMMHYRSKKVLISNLKNINYNMNNNHLIHITFTFETYEYKNQCPNTFKIIVLIMLFIIDYTLSLIFNTLDSKVICVNLHFNCFVFIVFTVIAKPSLYLSLNNHQVCDNCINHIVFKTEILTFEIGEILIGVIALILILNGLIWYFVHIYQIYLDLYIVERKSIAYRRSQPQIAISMIGYKLTSIFGTIESATIKKIFGIKVQIYIQYQKH